jgi:hypothetical protein
MDYGTVEGHPHTVILTLNEVKGKNLIPIFNAAFLDIFTHFPEIKQ